MVDAFFRISVIDGALNLLRHQQEFPKISVQDAARQLQSGPAFLAGYDYRRAVALGCKAGWDAFVIDGGRQEQLRETLKRLIVRLKPFWARLAHLGRMRILQAVSEDQRQCLELAGLLGTPPSDTAVDWWDNLSAFSRAENERRKVEIGREGERRTIVHESQRLKDEGISREPIWIALEDNRAGFDVKSFQRSSGGKIEELRIEVKSASYSPIHFFLTRSEWNVASREPALHIFHIWNLETGELLKLFVSDIAAHIPTDSGAGQWREVLVTIG